MWRNTLILYLNRKRSLSLSHSLSPKRKKKVVKKTINRLFQLTKRKLLLIQSLNLKWSKWSWNSQNQERIKKRRAPMLPKSKKQKILPHPLLKSRSRRIRLKWNQRLNQRSNHKRKSKFSPKQYLKSKDKKLSLKRTKRRKNDLE